MSQDRSPEMIQVAYFFGRFDATRGLDSATVPPELAALGVSTRSKAIELFRARVGGGRDEAKFRSSLSGDIRYIFETLKSEGRLRPTRIEAIGSLLKASDAEVWAVIKTYLDPTLELPKPERKLAASVGAASSGQSMAASHELEKSAEVMLEEFSFPEEVDPATTVYEGAIRTVIVNAYERDPEGRRRCIAAHGAICCICGFDFESRYGAVAAGFIHVHHLQPLSEVGGEHEVDPVVDLRPVCPNCHAVVHRRVPAYSIDEVRRFLR